jgi:hypothetical protein
MKKLLFFTLSIISTNMLWTSQQVNQKKLNSTLNTALCWGQANAVQNALNLGANPTDPLDDGPRYSNIHIAVANTLKGNKDLEKLKIILEHSAKSNLSIDVVDAQGQTPFFMLTYQDRLLSNTLQALKLLRNYKGPGPDINRPDNSGQTAFAYALKWINTSISPQEFVKQHNTIKEIITEFLNHGAEIPNDWNNLNQIRTIMPEVISKFINRSEHINRNDIDKQENDSRLICEQNINKALYAFLSAQRPMEIEHHSLRR